MLAAPERIIKSPRSSKHVANLDRNIPLLLERKKFTDNENYKKNHNFSYDLVLYDVCGATSEYTPRYLPVVIQWEKVST